MAVVNQLGSRSKEIRIGRSDRRKKDKARIKEGLAVFVVMMMM